MEEESLENKGGGAREPGKGGSTRRREVPQGQDLYPLLNLTRRGDQCLDGTAAYGHGLYKGLRA